MKKIRGTCRHYNGTLGGLNACCDAGVDYRKLAGGPDTGWVLKLPCVYSNRKAGTHVPCDKMEERTREEIEDEDREFDRSVSRMVKVFPVVNELKRKHGKGTGGAGVVECPECKGVLHWGIAKYNGHIRMRCETEGCISFME